jgi:insulin-like growth factor 2 receptor
VGKASKRLSYKDQVLQLVYENGSPCPSLSDLRYKSVISFVCRPEAGPTNRPMLISLDKQTCTLFFSWHTPLACEQAVSDCDAAAPTPVCWFLAVQGWAVLVSIP